RDGKPAGRPPGDRRRRWVVGRAGAARGRVVGHWARTLRGGAGGGHPLLPFARPLKRAFLRDMPNIKQQKKRVRTAGEERLENLRYQSTIKTLAKRLTVTAAAGDAAATEQEHRALA